MMGPQQMAKMISKGITKQKQQFLFSDIIFLIVCFLKLSKFVVVIVKYVVPIIRENLNTLFPQTKCKNSFNRKVYVQSAKILKS